MEVKRYSFPTEAKAQELILKLAHEENELTFDKITTTDLTHGIVCLGFQDVYEYNEDTKTSELIHQGLTYDVDVFWKDLQGDKWLDYEVNPVTPNHKFA